MSTLKIKIQDHLKEQLIEELRKINSNELSFEIEDQTFEENQIGLKETLDKLKSGKTQTYTLEEADLQRSDLAFDELLIYYKPEKSTRLASPSYSLEDFKQINFIINDLQKEDNLESANK